MLLRRVRSLLEFRYPPMNLVPHSLRTRLGSHSAPKNIHRTLCGQHAPGTHYILLTSPTYRSTVRPLSRPFDKSSVGPLEHPSRSPTKHPTERVVATRLPGGDGVSLDSQPGPHPRRAKSCRRRTRSARARSGPRARRRTALVTSRARARSGTPATTPSEHWSVPPLWSSAPAQAGVQKVRRLMRASVVVRCRHVAAHPLPPRPISARHSLESLSRGLSQNQRQMGVER